MMDLPNDPWPYSPASAKAAEDFFARPRNITGWLGLCPSDEVYAAAVRAAWGRGYVLSTDYEPIRRHIYDDLAEKVAAIQTLGALDRYLFARFFSC